MKKSDSTLKKNSIFQNSSKTPVKSISDNGFKINDVSIKGPAIVLNGQLYLWDVPQFGVGGPDDDVEPLQPGAFDNPSSPFYGWTLDMFHVFQVAENKPEILLIGTGGTIHQFPANIRKYLNNLGIQVDVLSSRQAASTFNVLCEEGRNAAFAVLPLIPTSARTGNQLVEVQTD